MIRLGRLEDLSRLEQLLNEGKEFMLANNNPQWSKKYPVVENIIEDINNQVLYVLEQEGEVVGYITLDEECPAFYTSDDNWQVLDNICYLHRIVCDKTKRGIGTKLMTEIFDVMREKGYKTIYADTSLTNIPMTNLYEKTGFIRVNEKQLEDAPMFAEKDVKPFYALMYEKVL